MYQYWYNNKNNKNGTTAVAAYNNIGVLLKAKKLPTKSQEGRRFPGSTFLCLCESFITAT